MARSIRSATPADAAAMLDIYGPVVEQTAISFEVERPTIEDFAARVDATLAAGDPWLVSDIDGHVAGYAAASPFRSRPAYHATRETTVYVSSANHGQGVGRALMTALLSELDEAGIHRAIAGIVLPNPASVALHERLGFRLVGVFTEVGDKLGRRHDLGFWERAVRSSVSRPPEVRR